MTPEESEEIVAVGTALFQNISASIIFGSGLFGIYILAFIISMHIILRKRNDGWAHKALIAVLLAVFAMTGTLCTCAIASNLILVKFTLVVSLLGGLQAQEMAANLKVIIIFILADWSTNFIFLIADIAIVWRAWALWVENRLIKWTLFIILLADLGISIADAIIDTKADISINDNVIIMDSLNTALNLTVNVVATSLIAHRAWRHHQSMHTILRNKKTQVEAILLLMVESGAIFGVVQVTNLVFGTLDIQATNFSPVDKATVLVQTLYIYSAALNPVALVILVRTENTYEHSFHLEDFTSLQINSVPNVN
ncbi:hypothetical protein BT96DRAFT_980921 [Gymnopus androsaceus JB14]|uniref:G-protein coupled receptors family 1 profile domain-containing protein n=1 Tax=Gymnopus androsaceus JB14 TaxID=1447944 RepID=A0A6A4GTK0_9AGAR|nr:hypothetical protein BT96DRAFT_980921 [Gymnopus androsaceus JB14]